MLAKWINLIKTDIWRIRPKDHTPGKSLLIRYTQIMILTIRSFYENKCKFKASALTYYSLLSIVPVIALMFGIAKGFGLQKQVEQQLLAKMQGQTEIVTKIIAFANSLLENANGGFIAGIGVAFLFYTIIKVLSNIENSFNDIWGIIKPRSFGRKFGDYLSTMLVCPILLVIAGSMTIFVSTQIEFITEKIPLLKNFGPLFWLLLKILPFAAVWIVFTFIFIFMPNTKVRFKSAVVGGIVAGTIFQIAQFVYVYFQIGMNKYGAIYGSFAALPLFLLWLQAGWLIVLFGAEVSFAHQNVETYEFEPDCLSARKLSFRCSSLSSSSIAFAMAKNPAMLPSSHMNWTYLSGLSGSFCTNCQNQVSSPKPPKARTKSLLFSRPLIPTRSRSSLSSTNLKNEAAQIYP